jgi:uncharacterized protein (DUF2236 family)
MRDTGILAPDSVARRINREVFLILGGQAAVLMQIAHPLVAAGVHQHSNFRRSPLRRLVRTADTTLAIVYGDRLTAERALRQIDHAHGPVRGKAADGRSYRARDPELLLWVEATLVLTSLRWYESVMGRLPDPERGTYWEEAKFFARELGVPEAMLPATIADLERYEAAMLARDAAPDGVAALVAREILHPYRWLPNFAYWPSDALAAGLVPPSLHGPFGLRYGRSQRLFHRGVIVATGFLRNVLPRFITVMPHARRYEDAMRRRSSYP